MKIRPVGDQIVPYGRTVDMNESVQKKKKEEHS
jgi:hypothetical protein